MGVYLGSHSVNLKGGQPVTKSATLSSLEVTPSTSPQHITPSAGVDGFNVVDVSAIPSEYIIPSGTLSIIRNNTYDVTTYATAVVNISDTPILQDKTVTPTESVQTITADTGYDALSSVEVGAISSTYVGTGITRRNSTDLTASDATVFVPRGYYSAQASKSVTSGTAGTPTATKGTVSNNSVTVTPSVTNTTGYITGGTKTGTAVTVSASELVSGSQTITSNNTYDVTNLASVVVNVSGGGGASNFVTGTFTTGSSASTNETVDVPYSGSGYPLMLVIYVEGGCYNSAVSGWYNSMTRYAVGQFCITKGNASTAPSYSTSGNANYGTVQLLFKNSTTSATSYSSTRSATANSYSSSDANGTSATCVRWRSNTRISYRTAGGTSSTYGLLEDITYRYVVLYSE